MDVPKTEQESGKRTCGHCGRPLTLLQKLRGRSYCSPEHAERERRKRSLNIAGMLEEAARPPVPGMATEFMQPAPRPARPESRPRLDAGSGKWSRYAMPRMISMLAAGERRLMPAFPSQHFVSAARPKIRMPWRDAQWLEPAQPAGLRFSSGLLPAPAPEESARGRKERGHGTGQNPAQARTLSLRRSA